MTLDLKATEERAARGALRLRDACDEACEGVQKDIPALVAEIKRLREMIHRWPPRHSGACMINAGAEINPWCMCGLSDELKKDR